MQGGGYHHDDHYNRGAAQQFDTMNLGPGPQRVTQFDTVNLGAPVRVPDPPASAAHHVNAPPTGSTYDTTGETPMHPASSAMQTQTPKHDNVLFGRMPKILVIASVALRAAAVVSLIIAVAVIASVSVTAINGITYTYASASALKYALAVSIIGAIYSIYELVLVGVRLGKGHPLIPGKASLFVSYIGDHVTMALLLTGGSAGATILKDAQDNSLCIDLGSFCDQAAGGIGVIFLGSCFLAASLVISSYCFYKSKT